MVRTRIKYKFCNIFPYFWCKLTPYSAPYLTFTKKLRISFFLTNNSVLWSPTKLRTLDQQVGSYVYAFLKEY